MTKTTLYKLSLEMAGKTYKQTATTIEAGLAKLPLSWENIKAKSVLKVAQGKKKHEHLLNVPTLRRIMSNKIIRAHWAKNLDYLMKDGPDTNIPEKIIKSK